MDATQISPNTPKWAAASAAGLAAIVRANAGTSHVVIVKVSSFRLRVRLVASLSRHRLLRRRRRRRRVRLLSQPGERRVFGSAPLISAAFNRIVFSRRDKRGVWNGMVLASLTW